LRNLSFGGYNVPNHLPEKKLQAMIQIKLPKRFLGRRKKRGRMGR
jgi:hypothetical protein